jgi:putative transposase
VLIKHIFADSGGTYGHRRVHAQLTRWGQRCSLELVRGLMRAAGLVACQPRPWRHSLTAGGDTGVIPDLVARDFTATAPGVKMVGDITYIPTWRGWLFLATVIDCHTRCVIGWATADHYRTPLVTAAIAMAARHGRLTPKGDLPFRPGQQLHVRGVRRGPGRSRYQAIGWADRDLLR